MKLLVVLAMNGLLIEKQGIYSQCSWLTIVGASGNVATEDVVYMLNGEHSVCVG